MAININNEMLKIQFDKSHNPHVFPSFNEIKEHVNFGELVNFLVITEHQINLIDSSIEDIKRLLDNLPQLINSYFISLKNNDPLFEQKRKSLFFYDYEHDAVKENEHNLNLFKPINKLDVNRELNYLLYNNHDFLKTGSLKVG